MINPFTLHPALYWLGGPAIVALAVMAGERHAEQEAAKAAALASPPRQMKLQGFDPVYGESASREVDVLAQIDLGKVFALNRRGRFFDHTRWVAPLYATDAEEPEPTLSAVLFETSGEINQARIGALTRGEGAIGPIIRVNGLLADPGPFGDLAADVMAESGMILAPNVMYIDPFLEGREAGLGPSDAGRRDALLIGGLGGLVFAYGFLRRWIRRRFI